MENDQGFKFNHKKITQSIDKKEILLSNKLLNTFIGSYKTQKIGPILISILDGQLYLNAGKMQTIIYAESKSMFFHKEAPLTFEFIKNEKEKTFKMIVRENGNIVEEATKNQ